MVITERIISITACCVGAMTVCASVIVLVSYFLFKEMRSISRLLIAWLSLCDLVQGVFFAFSLLGVCICVCVCVCVCMCMYVCVFVYVCMCIYIYIYVYVCMCVCVYVCVYM